MCSIRGHKLVENRSYEITMPFGSSLYLFTCVGGHSDQKSEDGNDFHCGWLIDLVDFSLRWCLMIRFKTDDDWWVILLLYTLSPTSKDNCQVRQPTARSLVIIPFCYSAACLGRRPIDTPSHPYVYLIVFIIKNVWQSSYNNARLGSLIMGSHSPVRHLSCVIILEIEI